MHNLDYWRTEPNGLYLSCDENGNYTFRDCENNVDFPVTRKELKVLANIINNVLLH